MSQNKKLLKMLSNGGRVTPHQIARKLNARNPYAVVNNLRNLGYTIVTHYGKKGAPVQYSFGKSPRDIAAAGFWLMGAPSLTRK